MWGPFIAGRRSFDHRLDGYLVDRRGALPPRDVTGGGKLRGNLAQGSALASHGIGAV